MISKEMLQKMEVYEQLYFGLDNPVPFKGDLMVYPVLVKDYYNFYNSLSCITMDKSIKMGKDEKGRPIKVANPEGIAMNDLQYLITMMKDEEMGETVTAQVMELFELIFHIKKAMYCPKCGKEKSYQDVFNSMREYMTQEIEKTEAWFKELVISQDTDIDTDKIVLPKELREKALRDAQIKFFETENLCPDCKELLKENFSIKEKGPVSTLMIKDVEITKSDFELLRALVPRQNILDYDDDKYVDPDLKEELELKAKMKNQDYTSPTLEKQLICVSIGTGFTLDYLKQLPMRKLSLYLRLIDKKETYYTQLSASMSGLVTFKTDPEHWIFSDDKKNIAKELTDLDAFEKKFEKVT